jgi:CIC family chloride channel protein
MLLAALIGSLTGLVAIVFHVGLDFVSVAVQKFFPGWTIVFAPAIGGLLCGLLIYKVTKTPEVAGQGTDNMIYSFHHGKGRVRPRVVPVKLVASIITLGSGGSAGYEGPASQMGSGVASVLTNLFKMPRNVQRQFTLAGMAAGLGAIFKAPLAGALTSVEVLYREDFESSAFGTSIIASVMAFAVYTSWAGTNPAFLVPLFSFANGKELFAYALLGLSCVPVSFAYVKIYHWVENKFSAWKIPVFLKPAIGGIVVGLIVLGYPQVMGGSLDYVSGIMSMMRSAQMLPMLFLLGLVGAKILATAFTVGSGGSGGVFGPSLFIGGIFGAFFAGLVELVLPGTLREPGAMVLVGMGAFFAGAAKAPIAGVVMVCEMTGSYSLLPGLLIAAVCHIAFSRRWSIYKSQVKNKFASPVHHMEMDPDVLRVMTVNEVMSAEPVVRLQGHLLVSDVQKVVDLAYKAKGTLPRHVFPVYDNDEYRGLMDLSFALHYVAGHASLSSFVLVSDCVTPIPLIRDSMDLHSAMRFLLRYGMSEVYVRNQADEITGVLTYSDLLHAYDRLVTKKT